MVTYHRIAIFTGDTTINLRNVTIAAVVAAILAGTWWWTDRNGNDLDRSERAVRAVTVYVVPAERREFADELEALGTTRAAESVNIAARVSNVITAIRFDEGQRVQQGQVLVELENSEAQAQVAAAQSALVESRAQHRRATELLRTQAVSASQVETLEAKMLADQAALAAAQARLADHVVRAPFDGYTGLRRVSMGALVTPGTVITTLDDTSTILLDFEVPETFLSAIAVDQTLNARSAAYPESRFPGVVATLDSRVDPVTRAITVRAHLDNPEGLLRPGMFMTVRVLRASAPMLLVPEQALVPIQSRQYLYVVVDGRVEQREVTIGRRTPGEVEIVSGIDEGEVVIVEGTQRVRDGSLVEPRPLPGSVR
jgi:membrane fusion protein, multidrug efflux system